MSDRYLDFEELRPTGEASHIPDEKLNEGCGGEPQRQRVATSIGGYPDRPTEASGECQSCGASIPADRTKCRFCLTNHLGDESASSDETADATLLGIVQMVVESTTFDGAVAKGGAAAKLLCSNETEPAIDDYTLLCDLNETPAPQLADRWPSLPAAVQVASVEGEQLLAAAHDQPGWTVQPASENDQKATTRLFDESGSGIREEEHLTTVLNDTGDEAWLVPAIALTDSTERSECASHHNGVPTKEQLECQHSARESTHRFRSHESLPDETWSGQPIWKCTVCGSCRYGPSPQSAGAEVRP